MGGCVYKEFDLLMNGQSPLNMYHLELFDVSWIISIIFIAFINNWLFKGH